MYLTRSAVFYPTIVSMPGPLNQHAYSHVGSPLVTPRLCAPLPRETFCSLCGVFAPAGLNTRRKQAAFPPFVCFVCARGGEWSAEKTLGYRGLTS